MKIRLAGFFIACLSGIACLAQSNFVWMEANGIRYAVSNKNVLFSQNNLPAFEAPANSGIHAIRASSLWIGGRDAQGNLYISTASYDSAATDFFPGPLDRTNGLGDDPSFWNYVWHVDSQQIEEHKHLYNNNGYTTPWGIANWPGSNKRPGDFNPILAPFVDLDNNGVYAPETGEIPYIRGREASYFIINDLEGNQAHSGGQPLGVEIYGMVYTSSHPDLSNTVFVRYRIFNRSKQGYDSVFVGIFTDFMLGNRFDNYVSTDSARNMYYVYNGENFDSNGYGANLPAVAVRFLNHKLARSISFNSGNGSDGYPKNAPEFYSLLQGHFKDGSTFSDPISGQENLQFLGNPCNGTGWTEAGSIGPTPGERLMIGSMGPLTMAPGDAISLDIAYIFMPSGNDPIQSVCDLISNADIVQEEWSELLSSIQTDDIISRELGIYPNPSTGKVFLTNPDLHGKEVLFRNSLGQCTLLNSDANGWIRTDALWSGIYFLEIQEGNTFYRTRLVVQNH